MFDKSGKSGAEFLKKAVYSSETNLTRINADVAEIVQVENSDLTMESTLRAIDLIIPITSREGKNHFVQIKFR